MEWFKSSLLLLLLAPAAWGDSSLPESDQGSQAAKSIYSQSIAPNNGSRQAVHDNLVKPMVSGGTLTTPDGMTSFSATTLQSADTPLIKVTVWSNPATADVRQISIEQDLTGSGTFDTATMFPDSSSPQQMITTVCANGYAQCDTGTFSNCRFRNWSAASSGAISSSVAGASNAQDVVGNIGSLSSCYCFSRACSHNNNGVLDLDNITATVGGSVLAAFLGAKTGMIVTSAQSTGSGIITYYGVASTSVPNGPKAASLTPAQSADMPAISTLDATQVQSYYDSSGAGLQGLADSAKQQQMNTPNSLFNLVAAASTHLVGNTYSCSNLMTPTLEVVQRTVTQSGGQDGSKTFCVDQESYVELTQSGPTSFALGVSASPNGNHCGGTLPFNAALNYNSIPVDTFNFVQPAATTGYSVTSVSGTVSVSGGGCSPGQATALWTPAIGLNTPVVALSSAVCGDPGAQNPSYSWQFTVAFDSQEISTVSNPGCAQFEQDRNCTPIDETWDLTRPIRLHGLPTGFTVTQATKDIPGPVRNVHIVAPPDRPWFRQDKTFYCKNTGPGYDFTALGRRVKGIQDSTTMPTDSSMTYKDKDKDGNDVTYSYDITKKGALPACSQVCKTKIPSGNVALLGSGQAATTTMTNSGVLTQTSTFYFKDCIGNSDSTWTCPVDPAKGETVVTQCGCSSDMSGVIGALTAADEAAKDSICSKH